LSKYETPTGGGVASGRHRASIFRVKIIDKLRSWWRGPDADPAARAEAQKLRQDMETRRTGVLTGSQNLAHRGGKDDTGRGNW
jgi:hypothetical protein